MPTLGQKKIHRPHRKHRCGLGLLGRLRFDEMTGCWNWTGIITWDGYGQITYHKRIIKVHRLAAHFWLGFSLNDSKLVCHKCDNRACFKPKHLFFGTNFDNMRDSVQKGRHRGSRITHCPKGHEYSSANTRMEGQSRHCRTCHREEERRRRNAKSKAGARTA